MTDPRCGSVAGAHVHRRAGEKPCPDCNQAVNAYYRGRKRSGTGKARGPWETPEQRLWERVEKTETCWNWTGTPHAGYGRLKVGDRRVLAHRFSYELANGPITDGMFLDHVCRNRACVNPDHLREVTNKQNMENRAADSQISASGVRGVSWHRRMKKWTTHATHDGQDYYFGLYDSLDDAAEAVREGRKRLHTHNETDRKAA